MKPEYYEAILERLQKDYDLHIDRSEHPGITEFYEGPLPLFKLILSAPEEDNPAILIVAFHIELDSPTAIQWYTRIRGLDPNVHLSACYLKDAEGTSYVGEDADIMRQHMMEQDLLSSWAASDIDPEEILGQKPPIPPPSPIKTFSNYKKAIVAFHRMKKNKKDLSH